MSRRHSSKRKTRVLSRRRVRRRERASEVPTEKMMGKIARVIGHRVRRIEEEAAPC